MPADNRQDIPPGWDYNPASWSQRLPIVALALVGFGIALYLSLYQWGVIDRVWEPFFSATGFGGQSRYILRKSGISQKTMQYIFVPDAFLGAMAYFADAVAGVIGGRSRWRTMPWIVVIFGVLVGPLGLVSIFLVIAQPVFYEAWCTLCLASAVVSLLMIGPAMDELMASMQYVQRQRRQGRSGWRVFWGLNNEVEHEAAVTQPIKLLGYSWAQVLCTLAGLWLMAAPAMLGYGGAAQINDRIIGPLVVTFAFVAIWEATRPLRWVNVLLGAWLVVAPWVLGYPSEATVSSMAAGAIVAALSLLHREKVHRYDGGWPATWRARQV